MVEQRSPKAFIGVRFLTFLFWITRWVATIEDGIFIIPRWGISLNGAFVLNVHTDRKAIGGLVIQFKRLLGATGRRNSSLEPTYGADVVSGSSILPEAICGSATLDKSTFLVY